MARPPMPDFAMPSDEERAAERERERERAERAAAERRDTADHAARASTRAG